MESPLLPAPSSPPSYDYPQLQEGALATQPGRRAVVGDHAVPLDPAQLEKVLEK